MLDFFNQNCQTPSITATKFGIRDDLPRAKAYLDFELEHREDWGAMVSNPKECKLTFTAVDKCIIQDSEYAGRGRCDAMLTSDHCLYFIELKDVKSKNNPWRKKAKAQLESTIQFFIEAHAAELANFKHKKAFACNKNKPYFQQVDQEENLAFFRKYGFRIDIQAEIVVIS